MTGTGAHDLAWLAGELSAVQRELLPPEAACGLHLALDQGGQSSRAVLYDADGREVTSAHVPVATRREGDRVEHDPEELVQSLLTAARDACESPLVAGRPIVAAGLATQRSTVCCWDTTDGTALSAALSWQDRRNAAWLEAHLGERSEWVRELTGLPLSPHYGASKLRWCLDELPAVSLALRDGRLAMGPLASFLLHRSCAGRPVLVDPANASRTQLFDPTVLDWSPPLLEAFGVPRSALPQCVGTLHPFGSLALEGGLQIPVRACSGDQSAALFAFGTPTSSTAFVNVGTGAFVQRAVRDAAGPPPRGLLKSVLAATTDDAPGALYCHEGTVNGGYAALDWLATRVAIDVQRTVASLPATPSDGVLRVLFMNGVGGLGSPFWRPSFESGFVDAGGRAIAPDSVDEVELVIAIVDSIAFLIATNVALMQRAAPLRRLVITGGLASCDRLCSVLAEVSGLPVERPELREATSRGIAFLAAGQPAGWQPVPVERRFVPRARAPVLERYAHWQEAMAQRGAD